MSVHSLSDFEGIITERKNVKGNVYINANEKTRIPQDYNLHFRFQLFQAGICTLKELVILMHKYNMIRCCKWFRSTSFPYGI